MLESVAVHMGFVWEWEFWNSWPGTTVTIMKERTKTVRVLLFLFILFLFFSFLSRAVAHTPVPLTSPLFPSVYCFFTILALKPLERLGGEADGGINRYLRGWMAINIPLWHWTQNRIYGPVLSPGICCCCGVLERAELTRGNRCASTFFCRERWSKQFSL